ncbi:MAG TPA: pentapeptide repeat-containing protein [Pirellulales bacterium]|nr:pentapeptide repeat-containing protein [Pirellulales bacterium]
MLFSLECGSLKICVEAAVKAGVDLKYASLDGASLDGARLDGASLDGARLDGASLDGARLVGARLDGARLVGASLVGASLDGASLEWSSRDLIAKILCQAAGDDIEKRKVAGLILVSRDWCWDQFLEIDDPLREWAIETLAKFVQPDDSAPEVLADAAEKLRKVTEPVA